MIEITQLSKFSLNSSSSLKISWRRWQAWHLTSFRMMCTLDLFSWLWFWFSSEWKFPYNIILANLDLCCINNSLTVLKNYLFLNWPNSRFMNNLRFQLILDNTNTKMFICFKYEQFYPPLLCYCLWKYQDNKNGKYYLSIIIKVGILSTLRTGTLYIIITTLGQIKLKD